MKKLFIVSTFILIIFLFCLNVIQLNASSSYSITPFTAPEEWGNVWDSTNWNTTDDNDLYVSNKKVLNTCNPFFEHKYTVYAIEDNYHSGYYIAILIDMYVNPNNTSGKKCRSQLVIVDSYLQSAYYGELYDGGPIANASSTVVTHSIGGGIQVGHNGESIQGAITGSFERSVTNSKPDLGVYGQRIKRYKNQNPNATEFIAYYEYYDPYRNDCNYLSSSTPLQYGVIYHIDHVGYAGLRIEYEVNFIWDGTIFEGNHSAKITKSVNIEFSLPLDHIKFYV